MGYDTFVNVGVLIFSGAICIYAIISIINLATSNIIFWMMRPSEKTAMDVVGRVTAIGATTGDVTTTYRTEIYNNEYYLINSGKMTCVITKRVQTKTGLMNWKMTTINCYSAPVSMDLKLHRMEESIKIELEKFYEDGLVINER